MAVLGRRRVGGLSARRLTGALLPSGREAYQRLPIAFDDEGLVGRVVAGRGRVGQRSRHGGLGLPCQSVIGSTYLPTKHGPSF